MIDVEKYYELSSDPSRKEEYEKLLVELSNTTDSKKFFKNDTDRNKRNATKREKFQDAIIENYLSSYEPQESPRVHIIVGSIGSGKTSVKDTVTKSKKQRDYLYINFDDIKKKLPEYKLLKKLNPKEAAQFVQSESSTIAGKLFKKAVKNKVHIIFEKNITTKEDGSLQLVLDLERALNNDYLTIIHVVFLETSEQAWERVQKRYEKIRRYVPKKKVEETFNDLFPNLNRIMKTEFKKSYFIRFWYNPSEKIIDSYWLHALYGGLSNKKSNHPPIITVGFFFNTKTSKEMIKPLLKIAKTDVGKTHTSVIVDVFWDMVPDVVKKQFKSLDFFKKICDK